MITAYFLSVLLSFVLRPSEGWNVISRENYALYYQDTDSLYLMEYENIFHFGIQSVSEFFGEPYPDNFNIRVHPNRASLDSTWQADWQMPDFQSECWMVASGIASKLDLISPVRWDSLSCEHSYNDASATQQLITHELIHVFHGQYNPSPDFSDVSGIDWFVEGLAVYASGQLDPERLRMLKAAYSEQSLPVSLQDFWTGKNRYGLSGIAVKYIDDTYGRPKLKELLGYNDLQGILTALDISEADLTNGIFSVIGKL